MTDPNKILAIIPARAGSQRLQNKNIAQLHGAPLIKWTIDAALNSGCTGSVIVSTDSEVIADLAIHHGARVPFIRPKHLSQNESKSVDVVLHALEELKFKGEEFEYVMLLQPTSPLRTDQHIREAVKLFRSKKANAVTSVCPISHPIEWCGAVGSDLSLEKFAKSIHTNKRSQEFPERYRLNGAIYLISANYLRKMKTFIPASGSYAYLMDQEDSVDVDTQIDFDFCEFLLKKRELNK